MSAVGGRESSATGSRNPDENRSAGGDSAVGRPETTPAGLAPPSGEDSFRKVDDGAHLTARLAVVNAQAGTTQRAHAQNPRGTVDGADVLNPNAETYNGETEEERVARYARELEEAMEEGCRNAPPQLEYFSRPLDYPPWDLGRRVGVYVKDEAELVSVDLFHRFRTGSAIT
ncbi:hypothetical protein K438DRAFT_1767394 [Mycena galopus ATCC 62051]|nr:hypothetical protein K438DRAFT_1767394 [Mycena galopus ATCC 62051]